MASEDKKLSFSDYDAYGFDVDHTLAKYKIPELFDLVNKSLSEYLVEKKGYGESLLLPFDSDFVTRGIVYDMHMGNFLKLSERGTILRASHGTRFMTVEEICSVYGQDRHWPLFEEMIDTVNNLGENLRIFENFFDMPIMMVCARIVDQLDEKNGGKLDRYDFWKDVFEAAQDTYLHTQYAKHEGGFFPAWKENTVKYVEQCSDSVKKWLKGLKNEGKKTFILTSSFNDYAVHSMEHILGNDWREYFDLVLTFARKPGFFKKSNPFIKVVSGIEKEAVDELKESEIYSQGNHQFLMSELQRLTGKSDPKVLFFGDSLRSDVYPSKRFASWDTVLILEEMLAEQHCFQPEADVEPSGKKKRIAEPSDLEKQYLTSRKWGSFFTDSAIPSDSGESSEGLKVNYMNTLWGFIVRKYADIAIPQLEYVSDLCQSHEFDVFNHEADFRWGFYPGLPKALQK